MASDARSRSGQESFFSRDGSQRLFSGGRGAGQRPQTSRALSRSFADCGAGQRPQTSRAGQRPQTSRALSRSFADCGAGQRPQTSRAGQRPQTSRAGQRPQTSFLSRSSADCGAGQRPQTSRAGQRPQTSFLSRSSADCGAGQRPQTSRAGQRPQTSFLSRSSADCGAGQRPQTSRAGQRSQTSLLSRSSADCGAGQRPQTSRAGQRSQTSLLSRSSADCGAGQRPQTSRAGQWSQTSLLSRSSADCGAGQWSQTSLLSRSSADCGAGKRLCTSGPSQLSLISFPASGQPHSSRVRHAADRKLRSANWEGEHLWLYLRALDFDPTTVPSGVSVGPMMFETPNASAFHVVAQFLFAKLDKCRAAQVFRDCALPVGRLKATEFRKKCCSWLKEIKNEDQSRFPNLAPSALLSPGGPKFIHLMYCFARHAVLQDMKRNYIDTDVPFAGAVELAPKDVKMARARCGVASNKLLQVIQKENLLIEEYKKKSQLLIQEIKEMKSECEALQLKSFKMKENDPNDKIQKVRSIWTGIMEDLASLTKGKEVVDNILQGSVGQHVLDGASVVLRIPQILAHRVENDVHQHWSGNVYEAGNLNFLMVIRLLNEALRTLRDEICQSELTPRLAYIEDMNVKCTQALQNLKSVWINLMQRYYDPRSESISREQEDWAVKWKNFLGLCPFNLMVERNPQLGLLRASPPHSFHPSEDYDDSMFYQHLSNADTCKFVHEVGNEKDDEASETVMDTTTTASGWSATTARRISSVPLELSEACENRDALIEKIARTVVSESPQSDEDKGMALEDALSSLALNSFLTRKQIPQTPENLLTEIRSSWRKSLRPDDLDTELPSAKVMRGEAPVDAGPITQVLADPISMCSSPTSPTADSDPFLSERKSLLRSSEVKPQKKMRISHVTQSPILEISGMRETERTREQELKCIGNFSVQNVSSGEDPEESSWHVKRSVNTVGSYSEDKFIISVPPSDHCQDSSMNRLLNQNVSPLLRPIHCESVMSWIMDETFPEDSMDTTEFASSDSVFDVTIADVSGDSKNKGDIQESKQDLQSLFSPRKALKKTASASEEELHQAHNEGECASCTPDENLKPETSFELFGPLVPFSLDDAFIKTPSPASPSERKYSLSSLLASCQRVEEMTPMVHDLPLSLVSKLKEMGLLNEELGPKEPSSG